MTVLRHPSDELILGFAAGALKAGPELVVRTHVTACPVCRGAAGRLECLGGVLIEELEPAALGPDAARRALERLDGSFEPPPLRPRRLHLAQVLERLTPGRRRWLAPGIWMRPVLKDGPGVTYLLRSAPGRRLPRHSHTGEELVVVLKGAFADETGRYGPGDLAQSDEDLTHAPAAEAGEECICLISAEGPVRWSGPMALALQLATGL